MVLEFGNTLARQLPVDASWSRIDAKLGTVQ